MSTTRPPVRKGYLAKLLHTPKNYTLENAREPAGSSDASDVHFYVLGCAGNGGDAQKAVAKLMNDCALQGEKRPKFIVILGDNFYDNGVSSEHDPAFKTHFYDIYQKEQLTEICGVPCFLIPGNHDHNKHFLGTTGSKVDFHKIAAQIKHTFLKNDRSAAKLDRLFDGNTLDLQNLQAFNMPRRYYSCQIPGEAKDEQALRLFFIDTTRYVKEYIEARQSDVLDSNNQANWLQQVVNSDPRAINLLFGHHARKAFDKRFLHSDAQHYLDKEDIEFLRERGFTGTYNEILNQILISQGLHFDANFFAHTHAMYYHQGDDGLCQIGAGGGGGKLQNKKAFAHARELPAYLKEHGFVAVNANLKNKELTFDFHTTNKLHLKFKKGSVHPLKQSAQEDEGVDLLRQATHAAWLKYMDTLDHKQQHKSSCWPRFFHRSRDSSRGVKRADHMVNYLNQYEPISLPQALGHMTRCLKRLTPLSKTSFETFLNQAMQARCGMTYGQFAKKHQQKPKQPISRSGIKRFC